MCFRSSSSSQLEIQLDEPCHYLFGFLKTRHITLYNLEAFSVLLHNLTILFKKNILQSFVCEMRVRWPYLIVISAALRPYLALASR